MYTSKLARAGMKGRKRDTGVLRAVVTLAFVFIIIATILIGSIDKTEREQRLSLFGRFQVDYLSANEAAKNAILNNTDGVTVAVSEILAETEDFGILAGIDEKTAELGNFKLLEGKLPEHDNEITVEMNSLGNLGKNVKVGDQLSLRMETMSTKTSQTLIDEYEIKRERKIITELVYEEEENKKAFLKDFYETHPMIANFGLDEYDTVFKMGLDKNGNQIDFNELSENDLYCYAVSWVDYKHIDGDLINTLEVTTNKIIPWDGLLITMHTVHYLVYNNRLQPLEDNMNDEAIKYGIITQQYVAVQKKCILSGIIETYSDRWDTLNYPLANSFITQSACDDITNGLKSTGELFEYAPNYNKSFNLFLYSNSMSSTEMFEKFYPIYEENKKELPQIPMFPIYNETGEISYYVTMEQAIVFYSQQSTIPLTEKEIYAQFGSAVKYEDAAPIPEEQLPYRINSYSYPNIADTKGTLSMTVIAIVFVTTACAVFQIFITQIKRRTRKIALLKAVGATNFQVSSMLFFEGLYVLLFALPVGVILGFGFSYLVIMLMNLANASNALIFYVDPPSVLFGILFGALALFFGMSVPLIKAVKTPLTGSMSIASKTKRKIEEKPEKLVIQTFKRIEKRNRKANRERNFMFTALSCFIVSIMLISMFLCFSSFSNYNATVIKSNKPSYSFGSFYAMADRFAEENSDLILSSADEITSVEALTLGKMVYMRYDNMMGENGSPILNAFYKSVPDSMFSEYFTEFHAGVAGELNKAFQKDIKVKSKNEVAIEDISYKTTFYGISKDGDLFSRLNAAITEGSINPVEFSSGNEVIVLIPMYKPGRNILAETTRDETFFDNLDHDSKIKSILNDADIMDITLDADKSGFYENDSSLVVGNMIDLYAETQDVKEEGMLCTTKGGSVRVGAIIRYFPDENIWPFSGNTAPYTVIGSHNSLYRVYPKSCIRFEKGQISSMKRMIDTYYPYCYGETMFNVYAKNTADRNNTDLPLLNVAKENGFTLINYRESNYSLYSEALNNALIIGLLGVAASMISSVILMNTIISSLDQERKRFGILQSIGVNKASFMRSGLRNGIRLGLIAIIFANIILILILFFTTYFSNMSMSFIDYVNTMFTTGLYMYPYILHLSLCALFMIMIILMNTLHVKTILKYSPIENIKA
ncbi:MAG: FtsX-like permease family protein [Clostridia bacterium]